MMRETERKATIIERWRKPPFDCKVINLVGSQMQEPGLPDTHIIHYGMHIFIEFKNLNTPIKLHQKLKHKEFAKHGSKVYLVRFMCETEWQIQEELVIYSIKFKRLAEGCKLLFDTLITLEKARLQNMQKGGQNFPMELTTAISQIERGWEG